MAETRTTRQRPGPARGPERPAPEQRRTMPAGRVFVVMLVCLSLWSLLFAPTMERAAEASPDGARRTVALDVLGPLAAISNALQVTKVTDAVERALGRNPEEAPGGQIVIPPEPIPSTSGGAPTPSPKGWIRVPTAANKLRVVVVGDSLAAGLGTYLERALNPSLVRVSPQGRISTGLARPDYFNWFAAMRTIVERFDPDLVFVMLGENDDQALRTPGGQTATPIGTPAWPPAYERRVVKLMRIATSNGARVVWVGLPNVRAEEWRLALIQRQNGVFVDAANQVRNVAFFDTWKAFSTPKGGYTAYYRNGDTVELIRESDGIHFTSAGYLLLARAAVDLARTEFRLTPRAIAG